MDWFQKGLGPVRQAFDRWQGLAEFRDLFYSGSPRGSVAYKRTEQDGTITLYIRSSSRDFAKFIDAVPCAERNPARLDWLFDN